MLLVILVPLLGFLLLFAAEAPCFVAAHQYEDLIARRPRSSSEVEQRLWWYRRMEIDPKDSEWGRWYTLRDGERMIRYSILGLEPIDIVYDAGDQLVAIYSSYE
jgi:hypothetical protein